MIELYQDNRNTVVEAFGISPERSIKLVEDFLHGSLHDTVNRVYNSELPDNEKYFLILFTGGRLVELEAYYIAKEHEKFLEAQREQSNISQEG